MQEPESQTKIVEMNYREFLERVINEGIAAVKVSYAERKEKLDGSIDGFEACRDKLPQQLALILKTAAEKTAEELKYQIDFNDIGVTREHGYWYYRCYQLEVEWVCNVISVLLINENNAPIPGAIPTARGMILADKILKSIVT